MTGESSHTHLGTGDNQNKRQKVSDNNREYGRDREQLTTAEKETQEDQKEKDITRKEYENNEPVRNRQRFTRQTDDDLREQRGGRARRRESNVYCDERKREVQNIERREKTRNDMIKYSQINPLPPKQYLGTGNSQNKRLETSISDNKQESNTDTNLTVPRKYLLKEPKNKESYGGDKFIGNMKEVEKSSIAIELRLSKRDPKEWREDPQLVRYACENFMRDMEKALKTKEKESSRSTSFQAILQAKGLKINEFLIEKKQAHKKQSQIICYYVFQAVESLDPVLTICKKGINLGKLIIEKSANKQEEEDKLKVEVWVSAKNNVF